MSEDGDIEDDLSEINRMIKEKLQGEQIRAEWFLDFLLIFIFMIMKLKGTNRSYNDSICLGTFVEKLWCQSYSNETDVIVGANAKLTWGFCVFLGYRWDL